MAESYPPALRCLYEEIAEHGVDEIWAALADLGKLEEFLDCAQVSDEDDTQIDGDDRDDR